MTSPFARVEAAAGHILLSRCPGRDGSLSAWVEHVANVGASAVLSLTEGHEMDRAGASGLGRRLAAQEIAWHHLPITDYGVPDGAWAAHFQSLSTDLVGRLHAGQTILVHCWGGLGRSGLVAAHLLTRLGHHPAEAIARVRSQRPGAIETAAQEAWVVNAALDRGA